MFHALIMIASVDRHGRVALRSVILGMPFFHLFDFLTSQNAAAAFVFKNRKTIDVTTFLAKNNSLPLLMIQSRQDSHSKN